MNKEQEAEKLNAELAKALKEMKANFSPILMREYHEHMAKVYKMQYDCYRKEGFSVLEALRLTVRDFN